MMRLRRALVTATLSLLLSAATAHAECAWVLWEVQVPIIAPDKPEPEAKDKWAAPVAFSDRAACVADLEATAKTWERMANIADYVFVRRLPSRTMIERHDRWKAGHGLITRVSCLPDTVDPSGPKGK